jgi:catechol-2,3-dioxygenase
MSDQGAKDQTVGPEPLKNEVKLNHLNLPVTNPLETQQFLAQYFGLKPMGKANNYIAMLTDENGMVLTLTNVTLGHESQARYPVNFHIGFGQESEERVNQINHRLKADGFDVPLPSKQHGAWTFYFVAPGGFTIEVLSALA